MRSREPSTARRTGPAMVAALALLAAALGAVGLVRAGDGLRHRSAVVDAVPVTEVRAGTGTGPRPGVVVAHGFAGSGRLMTPIADTLARRGYVVLLLDFAGHGRNPAALPGGGGDGDAGAARLAADLDTAVRYLRSRPGVDPGRIGLVGHSMGAGAVTAYAVAHPDIRATVALSLPDAGGLPTGTDRPRSLLLLYGGLEFAGFRQAADEAVRRAGTTADRRAVVVPGVEHISILFAARAHAETVSWLDTALTPPPVAGDRTARPLGYLLPAGLLLLGFLLLFHPLTLALLGRRPHRTDTAERSGPAAARGATERVDGAERADRAYRGRVPAPALVGNPDVVGLPGADFWRALARRWRGPVALCVAGAAALLGVMLARLLPFDRLPLAVGGYVAGFLTVTGLLLATAARLLHGRPAPHTDRSRRRPVRPAFAGVLLTGYAAAAVAVPLSSASSGPCRRAPGGGCCRWSWRPAGCSCSAWNCSPAADRCARCRTPWRC
ncbi:dienelactone hydrolase family protein [Micromonospora zhanjiangensis]